MFNSLKLSANIQRKRRFYRINFISLFVPLSLFLTTKSDFKFGTLSRGARGAKGRAEEYKKTHFEYKNFYKELMWGWVKSWKYFCGALLVHEYCTIYSLCLWFFSGCSWLILLWTQFVNTRSMWTAHRIFVCVYVNRLISSCAMSEYMRRLAVFVDARACVRACQWIEAKWHE